MRFSKMVLTLTLASVTSSPLAHADKSGWSQRATINTVVWEHEFYKVSVAAVDCSISMKLAFKAPESGYTNKAAVRNFYYFHARVNFDQGQKFVTGYFRTSKPGEKLYSWTHDTSGEGCWAKEQRKLRGVDVVGCRGKRCPVPDFE